MVKKRRKIENLNFCFKVEMDTMILEKDHGLRSMLEQAIGLARFLKKDSVVELLFELLGDPVRMEAISDDPVIRFAYY